MKSFFEQVDDDDYRGNEQRELVRTLLVLALRLGDGTHVLLYTLSVKQINQGKHTFTSILSWNRLIIRNKIVLVG